MENLCYRIVTLLGNEVPEQCMVAAESAVRTLECNYKLDVMPYAATLLMVHLHNVCSGRLQGSFDYDISTVAASFMLARRLSHSIEDVLPQSELLCSL